MRNIVLFCYNRPTKLNAKFSIFLTHAITFLHEEIETEVMSWATIAEALDLVRRFAALCFRANDDDLILQFLDANLANAIAQILDRWRGEKDVISNVLAIFALMMVDDDLVSYIYSTDVLNCILRLIKQDSISNNGDIMSTATVCKSLIEYKPYAHPEKVKIDFLAFLLKKYSNSDNPIFKEDMIGMLLDIYNEQCFKELFIKTEIVRELATLSGIVQLEQLIREELFNSQSIKVVEQKNTPSSTWQSSFPKLIEQSEITVAKLIDAQADHLKTEVEHADKESQIQVKMIDVGISCSIKPSEARREDELASYKSFTFDNEIGERELVRFLHHIEDYYPSNKVSFFSC